MTIYCGIDWAEAHHDVAVVDDVGTRLAKARITDDMAGFMALCQLLAEVSAAVPVGDDGAAGAAVERAEVGDGVVPVDVAIETDRGLLVAALAAGHRVWSINPKAVDRYRDRYSSTAPARRRRARDGTGPDRAGSGAARHRPGHPPP